jgi:hypothetical protein
MPEIPFNESEVTNIMQASKAMTQDIYWEKYQTVELFLKENDIHYEKNIPIIGTTKKKYRIDLNVFNHQDSLMEILSPKSRSGIKHKVDGAFRIWYDIDKQAQKFSVLNDVPMIFMKNGT